MKCGGQILCRPRCSAKKRIMIDTNNEYFLIDHNIHPSNVSMSRYVGKVSDSLTFFSSSIVRKRLLPGCWLNQAPRPDKTSFTVGSIVRVMCQILRWWGRIILIIFLDAGRFHVLPGGNDATVRGINFHYIPPDAWSAELILSCILTMLHQDRFDLLRSHYFAVVCLALNSAWSRGK